MLNNLRNYTDASRVEENVMMSGHTTFRVGGPAKVMVTVNSVSELKNVVTYLSERTAI